MARQDIPITAIPNPYAAEGVAITMTAADPSNKSQIVATGREIVIAHNTGALARTVTITSVADPYGRTKDITAESIAPGALRVYGAGLEITGWQQTDGKLYFEANHAEVKFGVLRLS